MTILLPKLIGTEQGLKQGPLFFLAGPVRGGGDWQAEMAKVIMASEPDALIAIPCRWGAEHPMAKHFMTPFIREAPNRQTVWERHYLKEAGLNFERPGCVIFWLGLESSERPHPGPEPYAMDTRRELGTWKAYVELLQARVVIGGDRAFHGLDVILNEYAHATNTDSFPFYESMAELVTAARVTAHL